jgi:competence protein ComEA
VSLGSATLEQLDSLDGIGPALAKRIVEWRQTHGGFSSVADLDKVPGIGPAKYAALKDAVVP